MTRWFLILNGFEAIWSVPKKYQTQYPANIDCITTFVIIIIDFQCNCNKLQLFLHIVILDKTSKG